MWEAKKQNPSATELTSDELREVGLDDRGSTDNSGPFYLTQWIKQVQRGGPKGGFFVQDLSETQESASNELGQEREGEHLER